MPETGREYAVLHAREWHIATFDGECFAVASGWQLGDRWLPDQVTEWVLLPKNYD